MSRADQTHVTQKLFRGDMGLLPKSHRFPTSPTAVELCARDEGFLGFLSAYGAISQVGSQYPGPPLCHFFSSLPSLLL